MPDDQGGKKDRNALCRKDIVPKALEMGNRYKRLWTLIQALSKVNWEILNLENK